MQKTAPTMLPLGDLVRRFSISFRLSPAYRGVPEEGPKIGCEVEFAGLHFPVARHVSGGCPHCLKVLVALLELHDHILSGQANVHSVGNPGTPFEKLIRYASTTNWPEVVLDIKIVRQPTLQPVSDNWVLELTDEIRTELLNLGCREIPFAYTPAPPVAYRGLRLAQRAV